MLKYNELRISCCKDCQIRECNHCLIGREIEALTVGAREKEIDDRKSVEEKVRQLKKSLEEEAEKLGLTLVDAGYITVKFKDRNYQISTNK